MPTKKSKTKRTGKRFASRRSAQEQRRARLARRRALFSILVLLVVAAIVFFLILRNSSEISIAENGIGSLFSRVQSVFTSATNGVKQFTQRWRDYDKLEAEYAVLAQRNEVLDEQNDSLASNAGLEDAARQKYGYVVKGDQTAVVTGLSETATDSSRDGENIEANVLTSSVRAPEEWYTPYLDAFFGVSQ